MEVDQGKGVAGGSGGGRAGAGAAASVRGDFNAAEGSRRYKEHLVSGHRFYLDERYENLTPLGAGSYGLVCSAYDRASGEQVAIKKIGGVFKDLIDAKRILREVKLLRKFGQQYVSVGK